MGYFTHYLKKLSDYIPPVYVMHENQTLKMTLHLFSKTLALLSLSFHLCRVYECNPLCRCDPRMCSNRLVQHGLQLRLELFMTQHKGWGIRCRDDVAKGTFVCVFTGKQSCIWTENLLDSNIYFLTTSFYHLIGKIVNEDKVNEDETVSGNDYLANLDFIEGVEKLKEGYESEAYCSDTEVESNKKTITMKTGPLRKNTLYQEDSSSGEGVLCV